MKKILCTTDFSKAATNAVGYAALIAEKTGATLTLLHVLHLPMLDTTETALVAGEVLEEQKEQAINKMRALIHHLSQQYADKQLQVDYLVREDLLADAVQHLTKTAGYNLVVIGSTGGGNTLEEILIGSNTESVIENVKCPIITVPAKSAPADFKHIVYASDYHTEDIAALQKVLQFAQLFGAAVEIVHVSDKESSVADSKANQFRNKLRQALPDYQLEFHEVVHKDEVVGMKDYLTKKMPICSLS